jgi:hypothetical protein
MVFCPSSATGKPDSNSMMATRCNHLKFQNTRGADKSLALQIKQAMGLKKCI